MPLFWAYLFTTFCVSVLAAVLADAPIALSLAVTTGALVFASAIGLAFFPRPKWIARHNHWIFVGLSIVALIIAGVVRLAS